MSVTARRIQWDPVLRSPVRAIQVETSSICNFRCPSCPLSLKEYDRPEKHTNAEEFRRALVQP